MLTNTFAPHIGGVARSIQAFTGAYRQRGHRVMVVAPEFPDMGIDDPDTVRVAAIQHFNGSDFSVALPPTREVERRIEAFGADIVHAHHPFLLGDTALRVSYVNKLPLVFTHHTMYEQYTHYVPGDSETLKRFVVHLSTRYANLCDMVFAPSQAIADILRERGVKRDIEVVPTGVDPRLFATGDGAGFRSRFGIATDAYVVGHVGRLAPEKNLAFLARSVARFLADRPAGMFLVVGGGPSRADIQDIFEQAGLGDRLRLTGPLGQPALADAYHAMDVFAFSSKTETQGMVVTEAMAAAVPVAALDAPGVSEVVTDRGNGRLLAGDGTEDDFAEGLRWIADLDPAGRARVQGALKETVHRHSLTVTADKALRLYDGLRSRAFVDRPVEYSLWTATQRRIEAEWQVWRTMAEAAGAALGLEP
ncbi:MAG: glycosyltransferase [Inquilinaceae bacterium]